MTSVALKGLFGRKTRSILTGLAIVLGVAMISGTYVLTDTIKKAFNTALIASYGQTDAVISGQEIVKGANAAPTVPASLLARVRALPDVSAAAGGYLFDNIELVGRNGKTISSGADLGFGVDASQSRFNPITLVTGRWASDPHEVVIDTNTAAKHHYAVGDSIRAKGNGPLRTYTIVGLGSSAASRSAAQRWRSSTLRPRGQSYKSMDTTLSLSRRSPVSPRPASHERSRRYSRHTCRFEPQRRRPATTQRGSKPAPT